MQHTVRKYKPNQLHRRNGFNKRFVIFITIYRIRFNLFEKVGSINVFIFIVKSNSLEDKKPRWQKWYSLIFSRVFFRF